MKLISSAKTSLQKSYRALIIFVLSASVLKFNSHIADLESNLLVFGIISGFLQLVSIRLLGNLSLKHSEKGRFYKSIAILFAPGPGYSLALLLSSIITFTILLFTILPISWSVVQVTQLVFAFMGGSATGFILYELVGFKVKNMPTQYPIDADRFDSFSGALIGAVFAGLLFIELPDKLSVYGGLGFILLPLAFALFSILLTYLGALLMEQYGKGHLTNRILVSAVSAILLLIASNVMVAEFLPYHWLLNGKEYYAESVKMAMHAGIIAGVVSGLAVAVYKVLSKRYLQFVLNADRHPFAVHFTTQFLLNWLLALMPLAVVALTVVFAYQLVGIYTAALTMMCMVSNVGVSLLITENYLDAAKWKQFTEGQKHKIYSLTPSLERVLRQEGNKKRVSA